MWFRKKATGEPDYSADYINGYRVRHPHKACPLCGAPKDKWCEADCKALDLMDYR